MFRFEFLCLINVRGGCDNVLEGFLPSPPKEPSQKVAIFGGFCISRLNRRRKMTDSEKPWFVDKEIQQAQYMNIVNKALLPGPVKDFLRYIASKATWRHTQEPKKSYTPCYASQDTIEIQMGRWSEYVTGAKKQALALGWIRVRVTEHGNHEIFPAIGINDPSVKDRVKRERWLEISTDLEEDQE